MAVVAHQVAHHFQQVGQRLFLVHKKAGRDVAGTDQFERLPDV